MPSKNYVLPTILGFTTFVAFAEPPSSSIEEAAVLDEVTYSQGKDTLVIQRIEQPEFSEDDHQDESIETIAVDEASIDQSEVAQFETYVISATAFDDRATRLKIWSSSGGEASALQGWSNIDWSVFQSVISFSEETTRYQFILFHTKASGVQGAGLSAIPATLPEFSESGARYLVTSSEDAEHESTLDFLESIHALYDEESGELHSNHEVTLTQQKERERQLKQEAAKPKTRVLRIWRHHKEQNAPSE